jgi:hypothetical protein
MVISIESVLIDERATIRIIGKCNNQNCQTSGICRDIDTLQVAAYESSLMRAATEQRRVQPPVRGLGH